MAQTRFTDAGGAGAGVGPVTLSLLLLCLQAPGALSQDSAPLTKTGPQPCPGDSSVIGYQNTSSLTIDMLLDHDTIVEALLSGGNPAPSYDDFITYQKTKSGTEWVYKLCPGTTFDLGDVYPASEAGGQSDQQTVMPIVPFVPNSIIQCGDNGSPADNCVMTGGLFQVVFEDDHLVTNVTFAGMTFQDNRLISVAAYGHQLNDGAFVNCIWMENSGTPILIDLAYDPDMVFGIIERSDDEGRRMSDSKKLVSKIGKISTKFSVDWETSSRIQARVERAKNRQLQDEAYPGMLAGFYGCSILGNEFGFGILNEGGRVELDDTTFEQNQGITCIVVTSGGQLAMHGGTTFSNNIDMFGPVFLDADSELVMNENVNGQNNRAMDRNGVPIDDACPAIFKEDAEGSDCLGGGQCVGRCCDFGMPDCFGDTTMTSTTGSSSGSTGTATTTAPDQVQMPGQGNQSTKSAGGEGGGCDTTCIVIATVVPVCTIALILTGIWFVRRGGKGNNASDPTTNTASATEVSSAPPPTVEQAEADFEPKPDLEHHMA